MEMKRNLSKQKIGPNREAATIDEYLNT